MTQSGEIQYNILNELAIGLFMKIFRLIKLCLNRTYSKAPVDKHLSDALPIQNGPKQGEALFITITFQL